jgi:Mn-dependent DtxR family transcriptional regulator
MRTVEEKIFDYISEHKKPVTISKMAKHFIASESAVKQALAKMVKESIVEIIPKTKPYQYRLSNDINTREKS